MEKKCGKSGKKTNFGTLKTKANGISKHHVRDIVHQEMHPRGDGSL